MNNLSKMKKISYSIIILLQIFITNVSFGQETDVPELVTDRPDQTESATVVPVGTVQLETGALYEKNDDLIGTYSSFSLPNNLFRIGIMKGVELRLTVLEYSSTSYTLKNTMNEVKQAGLTPLILGTKIKFWEEKGLLPETAIIAHVTLPVAGKDFKPNGALVDFRASMAHTLSDRFALGYNIGGEIDTDTNIFTGLYTLSLGIGLVGDLGMYVEIFGDFEDSHQFDGGFTYLVGPLFQLDLTGGFGLTEAAPDYYLSGGVTIRYPK